jgi:Na+-translocating ferredoxin:NAD+ oxidoreductase RnfG subunit
MIKIFSFSAFLLSTKLVFIGTVFSLHISKKAEKEINKTFETTEVKLVPTLSESVSGIDQDRLFTVYQQATVLGYAYLGEASSQTDTYEYLVVFDASFAVKKAKVLVYREDYGSEIGSKRWLKQFLNKTPADRFVYRKNIAAISGATISVKSMTNAMNNLMISLASWQNNGKPNKA